MSSPKFEITNPEAIKLIEDFKSGVVFAPLKTWLIKYKWFLVGGGVFLVLLMSVIIGSIIGKNRQAPVFLPPDISTPVPTQQSTVKSDYQWIKDNIINYSTDLPDPVIPPFDNTITLESVNI